MDPCHVSVLSSVTMNFRITVSGLQPLAFIQETDASSVLTQEARFPTLKQMLFPLYHVLVAIGCPWRQQARVQIRASLTAEGPSARPYLSKP